MCFHRVPFPPNKGEKIRAYQQVAYIAARHRVWLACFVDSVDDFEHLDGIASLCHCFQAIPLNKNLALTRGGWNILRGRTLTEGFYGSRAMWQVIEEWRGKTFFDVAFAFSSGVAPYVEDLPAGRRVLDLNDLDSHKWADFAGKSRWPMSRILQTESNRLAFRECQLIKRFDLTLMVNERECGRVTEPELRAKVDVFRTPMMLESYRSVWQVPKAKIIGYVGTMNYRPNIESVLWFAENVWPAVKRAHPDASFWIVGRDPVRAVRRLGCDPQIRVTGQVEQIRDYLADIRVFIASTQTEIGVQTKVLEALAAGRPTVVSKIAHEGIKAVPDESYLVADGEAAFAGAVCALLDDHRRCAQLGRGAVEFVRRTCDNCALMPQFEKLLLGCDPLQKAAS